MKTFVKSQLFIDAIMLSAVFDAALLNALLATIFPALLVVALRALAVTAVVAVIGTGSGRFAGCLRPVQHTGLRVVAISGDLPQRIRNGSQLIAVRSVRRRGRDLLRTAANGDLGVVAVAVIGEVGHHTLGAGSGQHVVIVVVGVGLAGAGRQRHFREIVAAVFVGGGLFLQVGDTGYIAVAVIDVAVAELLLEQLDPIKVYLIYVVAVK